MSLLDAPSLQNIRLTNKVLKDTADELATSLNYGTAPECCTPLQLESVAKRWPSIKTIKIFFAEQPNEHTEADLEENANAIECLVHAKWTAVEEVDFPRVIFVNIPSAQALAACTFSWGRLRKLKMHGVVLPEGLDVLATHGKFPSLEELDLSFSYLSPDRTLAGAALAKLVSRAPKLCNLNLGHSYCREGFIPLFELELPNLEIIDLAYAGIDDNMVSKFNPQKWPGLSSLVLQGNRSVSANGLENLLGKDWRAIKHLDLSSTTLSSEGMACLVAASSAGRLPSLTSLGVGSFNDTAFGTFAFAAWRNLERLTVGGHYFGEFQINDLIAGIQTQHFPALRSLTLQHCKVYGETWNMVLSMWNVLEELTLHTCQLLRGDFRSLPTGADISFPELPLALKRINFVFVVADDSSIWDDIIETIFHEPWPSIRRIEFKYCRDLPEELSGWKVLEKGDRGNVTVMERIQTANDEH